MGGTKNIPLRVHSEAQLSKELRKCLQVDWLSGSYVTTLLH